LEAAMVRIAEFEAQGSSISETVPGLPKWVRGRRKHAAFLP